MDKIKRKKVAHVLKSSMYSGAEQVALTIIKGLRDECDFVYIATEGPIREILEKEQIPFVLLKEFNQENLKRALKKIDPDLIHAHDFSATVLSILSGRWRVVSHLHYDPPWARSWNIKTLAYAFLGWRISRIVAVSGRAYDNLVFSGLLRRKTVIFQNPIDKKFILEQAGFWPQKHYDLLFVGRLVEQKDPQMFIEVVDRLKQAGMRVVCGMVGSGDLEAECDRLIGQKGLQDEIKLLGFQKNPYPYMSLASILCMTSKWEGYGLVAAEANVLGVPVLSTRTGGVMELFGAEAEELCDGLDDFLKKVRLLMKNEDEYHIWRERSLKRAETFISPDEYIEKINLLYKKEMEK